MKKILIVALLSLESMFANAQLSGDGYYRVYNLGLDVIAPKAKCYTWVAFNKAGVSTQAGTAQSFEAIALWPEADKPSVSEPATVIYAKLNGNSVDLAAQGTSVSSMTNSTLNYSQNGSANSYSLYTTQSGVTLYLWTSSTSTFGHYIAQTKTGSSVAYKYWAVEPISSSTDNYFGVTPTLEAGGKYYAPFYASFPFKFASKGMKAYYVNSADDSNFSLTEITSEVKPGATPMLIECSSANATDNRLDLVYGDTGTLTGNKLSGVYFCNDYFDSDKYPSCRTTFDASTMRVWNVENNQLVLSTATDHLHSSSFTGELQNGYLNANQSYLLVPTSAAKTLTLSSTGVTNIDTSDEVAVPVSYITESGIKLDKPRKGMGIIIVKYSDGATKKVVY